VLLKMSVFTLVYCLKFNLVFKSFGNGLTDFDSGIIATFNNNNTSFFNKCYSKLLSWRSPNQKEILALE